MQEIEVIQRRRRRPGGEKGGREWTEATVDDDEGTTGRVRVERGAAAEQKLKCLHLWQNQQPVDMNPGCRYRDGNKVTKKSCYRSMEHHSRGVRATRQIFLRRDPGITCARLRHSQDSPLEKGMFCSTRRRPSTEPFPPSDEEKSSIPVTSP